MLLANRSGPLLIDDTWFPPASTLKDKCVVNIPSPCEHTERRDLFMTFSDSHFRLNGRYFSLRLMLPQFRFFFGRSISPCSQDVAIFFDRLIGLMPNVYHLCLKSHAKELNCPPYLSHALRPPSRYLCGCCYQANRIRGCRVEVATSRWTTAKVAKPPDYEEEMMSQYVLSTEYLKPGVPTRTCNRKR